MPIRDVIIRPVYRGAFTTEELESLGGALAEAIADPEVSVGVGYQSNYGIPLPDVVNVLLPWAGGYVLNKCMDATLRWARRVWRRHQETRADAKPVVVNIYGPKGGAQSGHPRWSGG